MATKQLKRNLFQRLLGKCATEEPADKGCWTCDNGKLTVDLSRAPELSEEYGSIRIESPDLPKRVLVFQGSQGNYYAFQNKCAHGGRRLDPVPDSQQVQCCSLGKSTYDYTGKRLSGMAKNDIDALPLTVEDGKLIITV